MSGLLWFLPSHPPQLIPHLYKAGGAWCVWFSDASGAAVYATDEGPSAYIDEDPEQE